MKNVIKLTESDLYRIVKRVVNEQIKTSNPDVINKIRRDNFINPTVATNAIKKGAGVYKSDLTYKTVKTFSFSKDQMETGSDVVKKETSEYKNLVKSLINTPSPKGGSKYKGVITGGASAVGTSSGYDNKALAKRRADKLLQALQQDVPNLNSKFTITTTGVVGTATKLNSSEAYKEQFVSVRIELPQEIADKSFIESDKTITTHGGGLPTDDIQGDDDFVLDTETTICVTLPKGYKATLIKLLYDLKTENNINLRYKEQTKKLKGLK